jgi:hypothetical protein
MSMAVNKHFLHSVSILIQILIISLKTMNKYKLAVDHINSPEHGKIDQSYEMCVKRWHAKMSLNS